MERRDRYTYEDLKEIIHILRSENGCPWDKVQTYESLRPCVTEEAAEVVAAVRVHKESGDSENLCEELGDLMLQVVMYGEIAKEQQDFTLEDVVDGISKKMIRRHPHVFGEAFADTPDQVLKNWDEIKKQEKIGKTWVKSELRDIPKEFPALIRGQKVQKKLEKVYDIRHSGEESIQEMEKILKDLEGKIRNNSQCDAESEIKKLLWEVNNLARVLKIHSEQALTDKIEEVISTYET